jgi:excinuclease UvrABC helicase subunit UvrB
MKNAKISYWNNKWNEIYDFTPNKVVTKGLNYSISLEPTSRFVTSLDEMKKIVAQVEKKKGEKIGHLKGNDWFRNILIIEIGSEDLQQINL